MKFDIMRSISVGLDRISENTFRIRGLSQTEDQIEKINN